MTRPEAVNISNVAALADSEGKPNFKYVVEGANLFLTQQARVYLEKRKVILFKDSSTNKGRKHSVLAFRPSLSHACQVVSRALHWKFWLVLPSQRKSMWT